MIVLSIFSLDPDRSLILLSFFYSFLKLGAVLYMMFWMFCSISSLSDFLSLIGSLNSYNFFGLPKGLSSGNFSCRSELLLLGAFLFKLGLFADLTVFSPLSTKLLDSEITEVILDVLIELVSCFPLLELRR